MPDLVVHLRKPNDWAKPVRIHYWNTWPEQHQTTWPGVPMTVEADEWFVFRFEAVSSANLLFTDGHERQTNDLWRDREGWFRNGRWYDENPDLAGAAAQAGGRPGGAASRPAPPPADATRGAVPAVSGSRGIGSPDFREETIYFLMTTRFYDGDPSNNFFCRDRIKFDAAGQPEDPHWRGDFRGDRPPRLRPRFGIYRHLDHAPSREPVRARLPRLPSLRLDAHRSAPGVAGRQLPEPDRGGARAGDQDHPGCRDQPLLPVRHPRDRPYRSFADQVLRAARQAAGTGELRALQGQPRQLRLAEPRRHRQSRRARLVPGAPRPRPAGHRAAG